MTLWNNGKPLMWDVICPDTLAHSYRSQDTEQWWTWRREGKQTSLGVGYLFLRHTYTLGAMGKGSTVLAIVGMTIE